MTTSNFKGLAGYGLCECGCGEKTKIAERNNAERGHVKGQPRRFVAGHSNRARRGIVQKNSPTYTVDENGCWIWGGATYTSGYGSKWDGEKRRMAHRVFYEQLVGPIPEGLELDHLCGVRLCVNPEHLEPVTREQNQRRAGTLRLTAEQAAAIRVAPGLHREIAERFGVHVSTVGQIKRGRRWPVSASTKDQEPSPRTGLEATD